MVTARESGLRERMRRAAPSNLSRSSSELFLHPAPERARIDRLEPVQLALDLGERRPQFRPVDQAPLQHRLDVGETPFVSALQLRERLGRVVDVANVTVRSRATKALRSRHPSGAG